MHRWTSIVFFVLVASFLTATPQTTSSAIEGRVLDVRTGKAVPHLRVESPVLSFEESLAGPSVVETNDEGIFWWESSPEEE